MNSRFFKQKAYIRPRERVSAYDSEASHLLGDGCDSDGTESIADNRFALRPKRPMLHYIEHALQSGDTLSSLSIRYNCPVARIKQANNILRENEIFALRSIRIPVAAFSSLRDDVPGIHSTHPNQRRDTELDQDIPRDLIKTEWDERSSLSDTAEDLHDPLLVPIPLPLVDLSDSEPPDLELLEPFNQVKKSESIFNCSGADCGISWIALLICILVLGFLGPLIYVFFLYEHEQEVKLHNHIGT